MRGPVSSGRIALAAAAFFAASVACPIQRPPVPPEYFEFRAQLERAVADTAGLLLAGRGAAQERLSDILPELSALLATDSLLAHLGRDPLLSPLAGAISAVLASQLDSERVGGRVRKGFRVPDGQRLAVDAIIIGLGAALRRLRGGQEGG